MSNRINILFPKRQRSTLLWHHNVVIPLFNTIKGTEVEIGDVCPALYPRGNLLHITQPLPFHLGTWKIREDELSIPVGYSWGHCPWGSWRMWTLFFSVTFHKNGNDYFMLMSFSLSSLEMDFCFSSKSQSSKCVFREMDTHFQEATSGSGDIHTNRDASIDCGYQCEHLACSSEVELNTLPSSVSLSASIHLSLLPLSVSYFLFFYPSLFLPACLLLCLSCPGCIPLSCYLFSC